MTSKTANRDCCRRTVVGRYQAKPLPRRITEVGERQRCAGPEGEVDKTPHSVRIDQLVDDAVPGASTGQPGRRCEPNREDVRPGATDGRPAVPASPRVPGPHRLAVGPSHGGLTARSCSGADSPSRAAPKLLRQARLRPQRHRCSAAVSANALTFNANQLIDNRAYRTCGPRCPPCTVPDVTRSPPLGTDRGRIRPSRSVRRDGCARRIPSAPSSGAGSVTPGTPMAPCPAARPGPTFSLFRP